MASYLTAYARRINQYRQGQGGQKLELLQASGGSDLKRQVENQGVACRTQPPFSDDVLQAAAGQELRYDAKAALRGA